MLRTYFDQGGLMMWPLLVCSVLLFALLGERLLALLLYKSGSLLSRARSVLRKPRKPKSPCVRGERSSLPSAHETGRVTPAREVHQRLLKFFWDIPPQLGLLGTVLGLVTIFQGELGAEAFGRGVGTACFTTVFGLLIAVVARAACYTLDALYPTTPPEQTESVS